MTAKVLRCPAVTSPILGDHHPLCWVIPLKSILSDSIVLRLNSNWHKNVEPFFRIAVTLFAEFKACMAFSIFPLPFSVQLYCPSDIMSSRSNDVFCQSEDVESF